VYYDNFTDVSEERIASIFSVEEQAEQSGSRDTIRTTTPQEEINEIWLPEPGLCDPCEPLDTAVRHVRIKS
jgi:hypothetical protein